MFLWQIKLTFASLNNLFVADAYFVTPNMALVCQNLRYLDLLYLRYCLKPFKNNYCVSIDLKKQNVLNLVHF